ncbi:MAG TPA: response regulator [Terriglobales bacterium]|nr:response regulator [Terriglobales bacterium]
MKKILIAEDNAINRELLRELLETRGFEVIEACNGQEALEKIEETQPDLLLLDLGMPVLDGFGAMRKIRENPRSASLPVVAVTAYAMQGDQEKTMEAGFDGYLSKPISAALLEKELNRFLSKNDLENDFRVRANAVRTGE